MKKNLFNSFIALLAFCFIFTSVNPGQVLAQTIDHNDILSSSEEFLLEDDYLEEGIDVEAEDYVGPNDEINYVEPTALPVYVIPAVIKGFQIGGKWYVKKYGKNYATTGKTTNLALRNGSLSGTVHAVTKVPFVEGFPIFNPMATVNLPITLLKSANSTQFKHANKEILTQILSSSNFAKKFTQEQLQALSKGDTPADLVWHHHQNTGVLQLIDKATHVKTGHTGGKSIWGS